MSGVPNKDTIVVEPAVLEEVVEPAVLEEVVEPAVLEEVVEPAVLPKLEATQILALCTQQGCPERAAEFFEKDFTVDQVKDALLAAAAAQYAALSVGGDDTIGPDDGLTKDERKFAAEYDDNEYFAARGITKDAYIKSRKIEEGLEPLSVALGM
jgi:hypothetical protein